MTNLNRFSFKPCFQLLESLLNHFCLSNEKVDLFKSSLGFSMLRQGFCFHCICLLSLTKLEKYQVAIFINFLGYFPINTLYYLKCLHFNCSFFASPSFCRYGMLIIPDLNLFSPLIEKPKLIFLIVSTKDSLFPANKEVFMLRVKRK